MLRSIVSNPGCFFDRLSARCRQVDSLLCVGIDPSMTTLREFAAKSKDTSVVRGVVRHMENHHVKLDTVEELDSYIPILRMFCNKVIDETHHAAASFKLNVAFFECFGARGWQILKEMCVKIQHLEIPMIIDSKRGDVESTAEAYATAFFDQLQADCVTVNPYMGTDAIQPFVREHKGVFVLCKTSNPGANELQNTPCQNKDGSTVPLYMKVAESAVLMDADNGDEILGRSENRHKNYFFLGLVVGATDVEAIAAVRTAYPKMWMLSPGVGAQGGNLAEVIRKGIRREDGLGVLVAVSRGIYEQKDYRVAADEYVRQIREIQAVAMVARERF